MTSLTQALPLERGISNQLCFLIVDYFTVQNVWTSQVFIDCSYPFIKSDLLSVQRPALFCYPEKDIKETFTFSEKGLLVLELHFSFQDQKVYLAQKMIQIANLIKLINLNQTITVYCQSKMPGLYWIGKHCEVDYSGAYKKESVIKIKLDYHIDILGYSNGLQEKGFDIISPDEQIYFEAKELLADIEILDKDLNPIIKT